MTAWTPCAPSNASTVLWRRCRTSGLDQVERGELEEAAAIAGHLDADGSGACSLVRAAIAVAEGDVAAAAEHLSRFDALREQATGGNFGGLLAAEHDRLSALVAG
jgi:hypothetical protein